MLCFGLKDPFAPIQNLICTVFFGGMVDALKTAVTRQKKDDSMEPLTSGQSVISSNTGMGITQDGYSGSASGTGGVVKESSGVTTLRRTNPPSTPLASDKKRD